MTTTVEAIYENGVLKLSTRLSLPEKTRVKVTIQSPVAYNENRERDAWLKLSEDSLMSTWNNPEDLMSFSRSDVVLLPIPFTDLTSRKVRPAVVVGHSTHPGDLFVIPITSVMQKVGGWRAAGLNVACGIKSQIATVEGRLVVKTIGTLTPTDSAALQTRIRSWLQL